MFCCSRRIPRLLVSVGVVEKLLSHPSQGSSTERWSRNMLRVVTARVFYVLMGFLTSPFILNNSVNTAAPFNVVSHPRSESTCLADPFLYCYNWVIQTACIKWCLISGASGLFPIAQDLLSSF